MVTTVDLVVNTFERTYRKVLASGFFPMIVEQNRFNFARKIALINNVQDPDDARARAEKLVALGEIDVYYFVADHLEEALDKTGLERKDLGRIPHYTDCALVAVTLPGSPWLLYWDADVRLREPVNWVNPAIALMERDCRILVANPLWAKPGIERETIEIVDRFALGYGFSDQVFLVRKDELARPIYKEFCLASLRYPLSHVATVFEQRVDAYMRKNCRLRATYLDAVYEHPSNEEGASYPSINLLEKVRLIRNRLVIRVLKRMPTRNPCWKV